MEKLFEGHKLNLDVYKVILNSMKEVSFKSKKLTPKEESSIMLLLEEFIESIEREDMSRFLDLEPKVAARTKELIIKSIS